MGGVEGGDRSLEIFGIELTLRLKEKGRKGIWLEFKRFGAIGLSFLSIVHLRTMSVLSIGRLERGYDYLLIEIASHFNQTNVELIRGILVYVTSFLGVSNVLFHLGDKPEIFAASYYELGSTVELTFFLQRGNLFQSLAELLQTSIEFAASLRVWVRS